MAVVFGAFRGEMGPKAVVFGAFLHEHPARPTGRGCMQR